MAENNLIQKLDKPSCFIPTKLTKPIGIRIDDETREKIEKDSKKLRIPASTYANQILINWFDIYKPMLDGDSILFPGPLLKIFYNFVKKDDYETIANLISEYWHDSIKAQVKNPSYEDYLKSLEMWTSLTKQNLSVHEDHPIKHVIRHTWGFSYSKITCHVMKNTWESLGFRFQETELKENLFSYEIDKPDF